LEENNMELSKEQIRLVNWMYNFSIVEMKIQPEKFLESDQIKLRESVERRFPEYAEEIIKEFEF
jgi:hypothetical protein